MLRLWQRSDVREREMDVLTRLLDIRCVCGMAQELCRNLIGITEQLFLEVAERNLAKECIQLGHDASRSMLTNECGDDFVRSILHTSHVVY